MAAVVVVLGFGLGQRLVVGHLDALGAGEDGGGDLVLRVGAAVLGVAGGARRVGAAPRVPAPRPRRPPVLARVLIDLR